MCWRQYRTIFNVMIKEKQYFIFMEEANRLGVILEGRVQTQKPFSNGSRVNVSIRLPGDIIGPADRKSTRLNSSH